MDLRGPKGKIARRLGIALSPKTAKILERRPTPPGQHGAARPGKMSEYKRQLTEKQRLRAQYNLSERQLRIAFERAGRLGGNTGERLLQLLERRLDATVYRAGLAPTIFAARQLVAHGHVLVDGRRCDIPSRAVALGQVVSIKPASAELGVVTSALERARAPGYLAVDAGARRAVHREAPLRDAVPVICDVALVVEFYSR